MIRTAVRLILAVVMNVRTVIHFLVRGMVLQYAVFRTKLDIKPDQKYDDKDRGCF